IGAARGEEPAVGTERHRAHDFAVSCGTTTFLARSRVEQTICAVFAPREEKPFVWTEGERGNLAPVGDRREGFPIYSREDFHDSIRIPSAVGAHREKAPPCTVCERPQDPADRRRPVFEL